MHASRKTKIICTIGPASDQPETLRRLIEAGMNVARLNFSHGTHEEHKVRVDRIKAIRQELGVPIAIMLDTKGPEIRTGVFPPGGMTYATGARVKIVQEDVVGSEEVFSITYKDAAKELHPGDRILIADGLVELDVEEIDGVDLVCQVKNGGLLTDHKNVNFPDIDVKLPALTDKDRDDLKFAVDQDLDLIAASFVRRAEDIDQIRAVLSSYGNKDIQVIAKIESRQGVEHFSEIVDTADGIMIARGDLGVALPAEEIPHYQKMMSKEAYQSGIPSIIATQMLDSMIRNPQPTRAEVSDVANAIYDGASAIMLSGETAAGKYPVESAMMMDRIARYTEASIDYWKKLKEESLHKKSISTAISHSCCTTARDLNAKAIVTVTHSGNTARRIASFRPACPIIALTVTPKSCYQLALSWGVTPRLIEILTDEKQLFDRALEKAKETDLVQDGDLVVVTGGSPAGISGTTNSIRVETVGSLICQGTGMADRPGVIISGDTYLLDKSRKAESAAPDRSDSLDRPDSSGRTDHTFSSDQAKQPVPSDQTNRPSTPNRPDRPRRGYILVAHDTSNADLALIREAAALVVENPSPESQPCTAAAILHIPIIYGVENACNLLGNQRSVVLDLDKGWIY